MIAVVVKQFKFEAAHRLPNHTGKCRDLHGHSYRVEIGVIGPVSQEEGASDEGMVIDFHDIADVFERRVFSVVDHKFLNDVLPVTFTTAENIAAWIFDQMSKEIITVEFVRLWETATGYAQVFRD